MSVQLIGFLLVVAGLFLLFGSWALVGGGVVLVVAPEVIAAVRQAAAARRGVAR